MTMLWFDVVVDNDGLSLYWFFHMADSTWLWSNKKNDWKLWITKYNDHFQWKSNKPMHISDAEQRTNKKFNRLPISNNINHVYEEVRWFFFFFCFFLNSRSNKPYSRILKRMIKMIEKTLMENDWEKRVHRQTMDKQKTKFKDIHKVRITTCLVKSR